MPRTVARYRRSRLALHPRTLVEIDALSEGITGQYAAELRDVMPQIDDLPRPVRDLINQYPGECINEAFAMYGIPEDHFTLEQMRNFLLNKQRSRQLELLAQNHVTSKTGSTFRTALSGKPRR